MSMAERIPSLPASATAVGRPSAVSAALRAISDESDDCAVREQEAALEVRPARNLAELDTVYRLTHDSYVERDYIQPQPDGRLIHYPHLDGIPETTVLVALRGGQVIGTNSLTLDGPRGLHVDSDFGDECDRIRAEGRSLAASWRIATVRECRHQTRIVMELIRATTHCVIRAGIQTCVFTFNPRHERIYKRLLNMRTVARTETSRGLSNAPAVFMRLNMEECPARWLPADSEVTASSRDIN